MIHGGEWERGKTCKQDGLELQAFVIKWVISYYTPTVGFFLLLLLQRHECLWSGRIGGGGWGRGVQISGLHMVESSSYSLPLSPSSWHIYHGGWGGQLKMTALGVRCLWRWLWETACYINCLQLPRWVRRGFGVVSLMFPLGCELEARRGLCHRGSLGCGTGQ